MYWGGGRGVDREGVGTSSRTKDGFNRREGRDSIGGRWVLHPVHTTPNGKVFLDNRQNGFLHLRMWGGNVFTRVCLSVKAITFELLHIGTSFLVWPYIGQV